MFWFFWNETIMPIWKLLCWTWLSHECMVLVYLGSTSSIGMVVKLGYWDRFVCLFYQRSGKGSKGTELISYLIFYLAVKEKELEMWQNVQPCNWDDVIFQFSLNSMSCGLIYARSGLHLLKLLRFTLCRLAGTRQQFELGKRVLLYGDFNLPCGSTIILSLSFLFLFFILN